MTVTESVSILWIDDDVGHRDDAELLAEKRKGLSVEFLHPFGIDKFFDKSKKSVDLFLVDDRLLLPLYRNSPPFRRRGLSVAAQIREKFPEVPIYLFTDYPKDYGVFTQLAEAAESLADDIFELKTIQRQGQDILYFDAIDYRRTRQSVRESLRSLLALLEVPEYDHERITFALPEVLRKGLSSSSSTARSRGNAIALAKWTKRIFLNLPGFVYDALFSATKLGMTKETFLRHVAEFENARYRGIFSRTRPPLWWVSILKERIFEMAHAEPLPDEIADVRKLSQMLFHLGDSDFSRCVVCGELYPDTVGIDEDDETDNQPVHYRCSELHPAKPRMLYFDELRQFRRK